MDTGDSGRQDTVLYSKKINVKENAGIWKFSALVQANWGKLRLFLGDWHEGFIG